jgi:hypothetical protein
VGGRFEWGCAQDVRDDGAHHVANRTLHVANGPYPGASRFPKVELIPSAFSVPSIEPAWLPANLLEVPDDATGPPFVTVMTL